MLDIDLSHLIISAFLCLFKEKFIIFYSKIIERFIIVDNIMAVCVGVIAKENYPLYIRCAPNTEDETKFHFTIHTSLDVIEEKIANVGKSTAVGSQDLRELYLGQLYPAEDYRVYGYVTNTKVKFILVVEAFNTQLRDNDVRSMFRRLHNAYTEVVCNPFYSPGENITTKSFNTVVSSMIVPERKRENQFL